MCKKYHSIFLAHFYKDITKKGGFYMSPLETSLDVGVTLRSKLDSSGNVYSIYPVTRDIDVALTTLTNDNALTLDDKLKVYDEKHQEASSDIESLKKSIWSGTRAELMVAIENEEIADGTTVYITDDYSGEGQDLSEYATIDYVDNTFVPLEEGKGLSSTDVTSSDVERWNTSSDITTRLDGDATVDGSVAQKIAEVISGAPEKYDTLLEIANWIESDTDGAAAMDLKISENAKNIELKLDTDGGDTADNITTFTSNDTTESTSWTDVDVMGPGEKHSGLFSKISTMFKNIRYLYKLLGTTDISTAGDGTVSGAISTLNSNAVSLSNRILVNGAGWYRIARYCNTDGNGRGGSEDNSVEIVIQRGYGNENNEHHEFKLISIYGQQEFVDVCNKSNAHRFTKARYTKDGSYAYIEVYYSNDYANYCRFTLTHRRGGSGSGWWELIKEKTSETVDDVTITATYDIPTYSTMNQLKTQIDTLNSNISPLRFKQVNHFRLNANGGTYTISNLLGQFILTSNQGGAIGDIAGMSFITITTYSAGCIALILCGGEKYKQITVSVTAGSLTLSNPNICDTYMTLYEI